MSNNWGALAVASVMGIFLAPEVDVPGKRDEVLLDGVTAYLFLHMYTSFLLLLHNSSQMPVQRS